MERTEKKKAGILLYGVVIILCSVIAMQVWARDRSGDNVKKSTRQWQHLALTNVIDQTQQSELASDINRLGREGWELVSVGNVSESGTTAKTIFYFKKPL